MKRFLLFTFALVLGISVMAQFKPVRVSNSMQNLAVPAAPAIDNQTVVSQLANTVANSKSVLDDVIGNSRYDMQSNGAIANNRLYYWADGQVSAVWTMAFADAAYADRGTGYNHFDGSSWLAPPTVRLESIRTGWPSVHPFKGNGELVIAHNSTVNLIMNQRPVKGTGAWTQSLTTPAPSGVTGLLWPRVITNGPTNNYIHIICVTMPVANGGALYQGLDGALIYYRSLDGGATWDKNGIILPGLTSADQLGFSGDSYSWAEPKGDTIAFVYGDDWNDTFLMKSVDNGNTWTKKLIISNAYKMVASGGVTPTFPTCDGTVASAIDKNGVVHVAFGRMRAKGDATGRLWYPGTDGVVYWNSNMPAIDTAILTDIDSLYAHNLLIGYVASNTAGDSIVGFPYYYSSLSSFPQVVIDKSDNMYFLWSGVTVGNPSPDSYNYRHIWARPWFHGHTEWSEMVDLNKDITYMFMEYAYPAIAQRLMNDKILLLTQTSPQPGSNIKYTTIPVHDVTMEYREVPITDMIPLGTENNAVTRKNAVTQNYPNPVNGITSFRVTLEKTATVSVEVKNIMGQVVMSMDKGIVETGTQTYKIDASALTSGIYFYTVKINGESFTHKMIVK